MSGGAERLREVLGGEAYRWIWERVRRRLERGEPLDGTVTHRAPSAEEREAFARLVGRRTRGDALTLELTELAHLVCSGDLAPSLAAAATALLGDIPNLRAEREREEVLWGSFYRAAAGMRAEPAWCDFVEDLRRAGLLRRVSGGNLEQAQRWIEELAALKDRLPASEVPLARLAAEVFGDPHALDRGAPLCALAVRLAARVGGTEASDDAEGIRDAWAAAGVVCDELSAPLLVLNLRAAGEDCTARALRVHAEAGEPYRVSVRQLLRMRPQFDARSTGAGVFVCENPSVVAAAADALGARSAALVCVEGQPKTASRLLLGALSAAGIRLRYHGDFDWPGIRIANLLRERHSVEPWRMGALDYRAAHPGPLLKGEPVAPSWSQELGSAMRDRRRAVYEERVVAELLSDLAL